MGQNGICRAFATEKWKPITSNRAKLATRTNGNAFFICVKYAPLVRVVNLDNKIYKCIVLTTHSY